MTDALKDSIQDSRKEQQTKIELDKAYAFVKENGIVPENLAVFIMGPNEMIIGETFSPELLPEYAVQVKNPKRYLRLQQAVNGALTINLVLLDFDALNGEGLMHVRASAAYWLNEQSLDGQISTLSLYIQYFKLRAANKAAEAGIIVPPSGILKRG